MTKLLKSVFLPALLVCVQVASAQTHADGFTAMQLEQWDKAISIYSALVKADPADQSAHLNLSSAYLAKGEKDKAKAACDAAFNAKPDGALAFVANGRIMLLQNNGAEADKQFAKAAKSGKKDVNALRQIAESYLYAPPGVKPNLTRSEELLKAALDVGSKDITTLMTLGYCYKEMPNGGLAAQQYELAESMDTKNPLIKFMLAKVYKAAKLPDKFVLYAEKAIALNPKYSLALRALAEYYYFGRQWEKALAAYERLVAQGDAVTIEDEMQLANCRFINKKYKETSEIVDKIIAKDPSKNYLRRLKGYCECETGDYAKCVTAMNDYFKLAPADKVLWSDYKYRGLAIIKTKGDTLMAIADYKKAIELDTARGSETWKLNQDIAKLYYGKKDNCNALKHYAIYLDSVPKPQPTELYEYGVSQYFCKDDSMRFVKAEKTFVRITELVPKAGIGWLWAGKSAAFSDPTPAEIEANPEKAHEYGKALNYYEKYAEIAGADAQKNKKDLLKVYEYNTYVYFVKKETDKFNAAIAKWAELDPTNTKIEEMKAAFNSPEGTVPTTAQPAKKDDGGGKQ